MPSSSPKHEAKSAQTEQCVAGRRLKPSDSPVEEFLPPYVIETAFPMTSAGRFSRLGPLGTDQQTAFFV